MTKIIDGQKIARSILNELKNEIKSSQGRPPGLAFVLIGDDPASKSYVRMKKKRCEEVGILSHILSFPHDILEEELLQKIADLNRDSKIDGILVQQPFPRHISVEKVISFTDPTKDVDGFHPLNLGKLLTSDPTGFVSCTPLGIKMLLEKSEIKTEGRHVVIVGRSQIVGKPLAALLMQKGPYADATVTVAHSKTPSLSAITKEADILIAALGRPQSITKEMVKEGSVVVDVGINRLKNGTLVGDVDFDSVSKIASAITPVPGGVGPMTIAMLLSNTWKSYKLRI